MWAWSWSTCSGCPGLAGGCNRWSSEVPSSLSQSVILWFCFFLRDKNRIGCIEIKIKVWRRRLIGQGDPCYLCTAVTPSLFLMIHSQIGGCQRDNPFANLPLAPQSWDTRKQHTCQCHEKLDSPWFWSVLTDLLFTCIWLFYCEVQAGCMWSLPPGPLNQWTEGGRNTVISMKRSWLSKEADETHRKERGKRIKAEMYDQKEGGGR